MFLNGSPYADPTTRAAFDDHNIERAPSLWGLRKILREDPPRDSRYCQAVRFWRNHYHLPPDSMCDPVENLLRRLDAGGITYEVRVERGEQPRHIVTNMRRDGTPTKVIVWVGGSNPSCKSP